MQTLSFLVSRLLQILLTVSSSVLHQEALRAVWRRFDAGTKLTWRIRYLLRCVLGAELWLTALRFFLSEKNMGYSYLKCIVVFASSTAYTQEKLGVQSCLPSDISHSFSYSELLSYAIRICTFCRQASNFFRFKFGGKICALISQYESFKYKFVPCLP